MEYIGFIIILILAILWGLTLYKLNDFSYRLERITKRYNNLLRGRGEFNLEELLASIGEDIDITMARVDEIEEVNNRILNTFESKTEGFAKELKEDLKNTSTSLNTKINSIEKKLKEDSEYFNNEMQNYFKKNDQDLERKTNSVNEKLSFAIQKYTLHKYDAFENQKGKLSFTLVLLDRFNNGIMITSIYLNDSSYSYSKNIKNGKAEEEMSKEEMEALNSLIK